MTKKVVIGGRKIPPVLEEREVVKINKYSRFSKRCSRVQKRIFFFFDLFHGVGKKYKLIHSLPKKIEARDHQ